MFLRKIRYKLETADHEWRVSSELSEIRRAMGNSKSLLDLGCGPNSMVAQFPWDHSVGVDGFSAVVARARATQSHSEVIEGDVMEVSSGMPTDGFDVVVALDLIEHLEKAQGIELLAQMDRIAKHLIVVGTPNGFLDQDCTENPLQEHRSGWIGDELQQYGFSVIGLFGPKSLRGHGHEIRFRPKFAWGLLARLIHTGWTRRHYNSAAGLLAIKTLNRSARRSECSEHVINQ